MIITGDLLEIIDDRNQSSYPTRKEKAIIELSLIDPVKLKAGDTLLVRIKYGPNDRIACNSIHFKSLDNFLSLHLEDIAYVFPLPKKLSGSNV